MAAGSRMRKRIQINSQLQVIASKRDNPQRAFFFSSRRRHTRSYGDWSSDVGSSDLAIRRVRHLGYTSLSWPTLAEQPPKECPRSGKECLENGNALPAGLGGRWPFSALGVRGILLEIGRASCREGVEFWRCELLREEG